MKEVYSSMRSAMIRVSKINKLKRDNKKLGLKAGDTLVYEKNDIIDILANWSSRKKMHYYMIEHNDDPQNIHYHIVLWFDSPTSFRTIKSVLGYGDIEKCKYGFRNCVRYLWHAENPEKFQYSPDEVITNVPDKLEYYKSAKVMSEKARLDSIIENILSGKIQEYDIDRIDHDIYVKYLHRIENAFKRYKKIKLKNPSRNIKVIVLQGVPGAGKNTLCKIIAQLENKTIGFSSCSNDPLQDYMLGVDYFVIDDFDYKLFDIDDFKKLTDNNTSSSVKRRYSNAVFNSDIMIATNLNILDWYSDAKEVDRKAIHRRITCVLDFLPLQEDMVARYYIKSIDDLHRDREKMKEYNGDKNLYQQYVDSTYQVKEVDLKKYVSFEDNQVKKEEFLEVLGRL